MKPARPNELGKCLVRFFRVPDRGSVNPTPSGGAGC